ncbi:MAG: FHA domain-containing protein [Acidobacteriota bacterium]
MTARVVGWIPETGRLDRVVRDAVQLGASSDNEVEFRADGVSRLHARIVKQGDEYVLEDAGSRNGTWLNGVQVARASLRHLDVITLGRFAELLFLNRSGDAPVAEPDAGPSARLEWLDGPDRGKGIDIPRGEVIMGRAESCDVVIDSSAVSRAHARLVNSGDSVTLEDLGSVNGTFVGGEPLTGLMPLASGNEIDLGQVCRFRIVLEGFPARAAANTEGPAPVAAQDMEWATRLIWSASDLEAMRADLAAAPPPRLPAPPPPTAAPVEAPRSTGVVEAARATGDRTVRAAERTRVGPAPLAPAPPLKPPPEAPGEPATLLGVTPPGAVPSGIKPQPDVRGETRTDMPTLKVPPQLGSPPPRLGAPRPRAPEGQAGAEVSHPTTPPRTSVERTELPRETVLGFRDVAPREPGPGGARSGAHPRATRPPEERGAEATPPDPSAPLTGAIESVRLSGSEGVFVVPRGTIIVGRGMEATVRIDSREVSRVHAVLTITEQGVTVEERGSVNGTSVNGKPIVGSCPLAHDDRVSFADFEFRVEFNRTEKRT